jgi:hypothetical protein
MYLHFCKYTEGGCLARHFTAGSDNRDSGDRGNISQITTETHAMRLYSGVYLYFCHAFSGTPEEGDQHEPRKDIFPSRIFSRMFRRFVPQLGF